MKTTAEPFLSTVMDGARLAAAPREGHRLPLEAAIVLGPCIGTLMTECCGGGGEEVCRRQVSCRAGEYVVSGHQ